MTIPKPRNGYGKKSMSQNVIFVPARLSTRKTEKYIAKTVCTKPGKMIYQTANARMTTTNGHQMLNTYKTKSYEN